MKRDLAPIVLVLSVIAPAFLSGCVSQKKYEALQVESEQLKQQNALLAKQIAAENAQLGRLRRTVKSTLSTLERLSASTEQKMNMGSEESSQAKANKASVVEKLNGPAPGQ